jgi:Immunoglobulin I-set domain
LNALTKDDIAIEDHSLTLLKPSHHNSGVYHCIADEKTGKPQAFVTIHVKREFSNSNANNEQFFLEIFTLPTDQPIFPKHRDYVNTAVGNTAELHCDFTADPQPSSVRWFTNDRTRIHASDKYELVDAVHGHHNRSMLVVKNVEKSDLSAYHCEVENSIGRASEKVTLGLQPAPALFEKFDYKRNQVTAVWLVKSIQPLLEMQVLYKQKNVSLILNTENDFLQPNSFDF